MPAAAAGFERRQHPLHDRRIIRALSLSPATKSRPTLRATRRTATKTAAAGAPPKRAAGAAHIVTPHHVRRQLTETAVLTSAETLFVQRGFHRTTVDDIAHAAGLTKGAVYVHFKDKRDVLLVLLRRAEDRVLFPILKRLENPQFDAVEKLVDYVHSWARVAIEQRNTMFLPILMSFEFLGTGDPIEKVTVDMYDRSYTILESVIEDGRKAGLIPRNGSAREHAAVLVAFMDGLLLEWLRRGSTLDGEEMTRVARRMILSGLVAKPR